MKITDAKGKEELIRWQKADPTINKIRAMVVQEHRDDIEHDGILYQSLKPSMGEEIMSILQLVLLKQYRRSHMILQ